MAAEAEPTPPTPEKGITYTPGNGEQVHLLLLTQIKERLELGLVLEKRSIELQEQTLKQLVEMNYYLSFLEPKAASKRPARKR